MTSADRKSRIAHAARAYIAALETLCASCPGDSVDLEGALERVLADGKQIPSRVAAALQREERDR